MKSPIFQIIHAFLIKEDAFQGRLFLKTTQNTDHAPTQYYLIMLPKSRQSLSLGDKTWILDHHHISVYEEHTQSESRFQSAYHYTGKFLSGDEHIIVHVYFDREGNYLSNHLKDNNGTSITIFPSDEANIQSYAELASIEMISRIQQKAIQIAKTYKSMFDKAMQRLEQMSAELAKDTPEVIQPYLTQLDGCLEIFTRYAKYSYEHPAGIEETLTQAKKFLTAKLESLNTKHTQTELALTESDSNDTPASSPAAAQPKPSKNAQRKDKRAKKRTGLQLNQEYKKLLTTPLTPQRLIEQYKLLEQLMKSAGRNDFELLCTTLQKITDLKNELSQELVKHALQGDAQAVAQLAPYVEAVPYELYFVCTMNGHVKVMEILVDHYKFNINQLNLFPSDQFKIGYPSESLLHVAIDANQENMLIWLLKRKANPNITASLFGETALTRAVRKNNQQFVMLLIQFKANLDLPEIASTITDTRSRLTVNATALCLHESPLHIAAKLQLPEMVSLLLAQGARTDVMTTNGYTPFILCLCLESKPLHKGVVNLFLAHGAHIDERHAKYNYTGLYYACQKGRYEDVVFLVEHGADPNTKCVTIKAEETNNEKFAPFINEIFTGENEISVTPLLKAAVDGDKNIVDYLINQTHKPVTLENIYNSYMLASIHKQNACAQTLFEKYRALTTSGPSTDSHASSNPRPC